MSLTKINCSQWSSPSLKGVGQEISYVVFNPKPKPGLVVMALASGPRDGVGSRIGASLALRHFSSSFLESFQVFDRSEDEFRHQMSLKNKAESEDMPCSTLLLLEAFRQANQQVFEFGQKLSAGGRVVSSLLGIFIVGDHVSVARVGFGGVYVLRKGDIFSFFEPKHGSDIMEYLGAQSVVTVETAGLDLRAEDVVFGIDRELNLAEPKTAHFNFLPASDLMSADVLAKELKKQSGKSCNLILSAGVGPDVVYLGSEVSDQTDDKDRVANSQN